MAEILRNDNVWLDKHIYDEAERVYYEKLRGVSDVPSVQKQSSPSCAVVCNKPKKDTDNVSSQTTVDKQQRFEKKVSELEDVIKDLRKDISSFFSEFVEIRDLVHRYESRLKDLEMGVNSYLSVTPNTSQTSAPKLQPSEIKKEEDADDGVDLFGSDSEEEDDEARKVKEQRLAEYTAKKSKKPTLVAKSNIILDVKPWDDETDMKELEKAVRNIQMDGLLWGASKLVPLAFGIHKLQISSVVEDEKVSVDLLQEQIQEIEEYVQSVDIAAFNKI